MKSNLKHGDFTGLAKNYSKFRPAYSDSAVTAILSLVGKKTQDIDFADVGAGTGIWTRLIDSRGTKSSTAVEPNDDMRGEGVNDSNGLKIKWQKGSGEVTGLADNSADFLSMASSFHWVDFEKGTKEFARVLRKGGIFTAVWNPRFIEASPLLAEIENKIKEINPGIKRVSSGSSEFVKTLSDKLLASPYFTDLVYIEGRHVQKFTKEEYIGVWESVNDVRFQLGEEGWNKFISLINEKIKNLDFIEQTYLTRSWSVRKK